MLTDSPVDVATGVVAIDTAGGLEVRLELC